MTASGETLLLPGQNVSRETEARLRHLVKLVEKWTTRINLISAKSIDHIWTRHILDSLQLFRFLPTGATHWVDLGSGGGFPGLVISIVAEELAEDLRVTLVESDQRKAAFLRTAAMDLGLLVDIRTTRIESTEPLGADVLSARALGPLPQLLGYASKHLSASGVGLFLKGRSVAQEIDAARLDWRFDLIAYPSKTDAEAQILRIENIIHV